MNELLAKIEALEKRVYNLEHNKLEMFGRSYSSVGSSNSDYLIKTKGQVKIQWGNKFIDLIKDGKVAVDSDFIFNVKNQDNIGTKKGIYITDDGEVYLKAKGDPITLIGESGTTFVSFMENQQTTPEDKYNALSNIGFIYKSLDDITEDSLQNGIVYIENEQTLYTIINGNIQEYKTQIPNPYAGQFIISKNDEATGALVIKGIGNTNSILFNTFQIYSTEQEAIIDINNSIIFKVNEENIISISQRGLECKQPIISQIFQSENASAESGFRLYIENGKSILQVDQIKQRSNSRGGNIDLIDDTKISDDTTNYGVTTRIGNLAGLKDGDKTLEGQGIYTDTLVLSGTESSNLPKYTNTLNSVLTSLDIENSNDYDTVLVTVGLLKQLLNKTTA